MDVIGLSLCQCLGCFLFIIMFILFAWWSVGLLEGAESAGWAPTSGTGVLTALPPKPEDLCVEGAARGTCGLPRPPGFGCVRELFRRCGARGRGCVLGELARRVSQCRGGTSVEGPASVQQPGTVSE